MGSTIRPEVERVIGELRKFSRSHQCLLWDDDLLAMAQTSSEAANMLESFSKNSRSRTIFRYINKKQDR
jgi:hypothetical protein